MREIHLSDLCEQAAIVDDPVADDMRDQFLALDATLHSDHRGRHDGAALCFETVGPQDPISNAGLVLDRDEEDAFGAAGLLADQDDPGDLDLATVLDVGEVSAADDPASCQVRAEEGERVGAKR